MTGPAPGGSELASQFRAFHAELAACLRALADTPVAPPELRARLASLIDGKIRALDGQRARQDGSELRYLMAAFADEMLITEPWAHQAEWIDYLLEAELFGTRNAGDRVFVRIRALCADGKQADLAEPYLYALALGFRGCFGDGEARLRELDRLRTDLFKLASERTPDPAFSKDGDDDKDSARARLMARAYENTIRHGVPVLLPNPYRWRGFFAIAFGALLLLALWIWQERTSDLRKALDRTAQAGTTQADAGGKP